MTKGQSAWANSGVLPTHGAGDDVSRQTVEFRGEELDIIKASHAGNMFEKRTGKSPIFYR